MSAAAPAETNGEAARVASRWYNIAKSVTSREPVEINAQVAQQVRDVVLSNPDVAAIVEAARTDEVISTSRDCARRYLERERAVFLQWTMNGISMWFYFHVGAKLDATEANLRAAIDALCDILAPEDEWHRAQICLVLLRYLVLVSTDFDGDPWLNVPATAAAAASDSALPDGKREASTLPKRARQDGAGSSAHSPIQ
jgi:hypothetical protein